MSKLTIEERARLMVRCSCRDCRHVNSFWDANLELTARAHRAARWARDNPLDAVAQRVESNP